MKIAARGGIGYTGVGTEIVFVLVVVVVVVGVTFRDLGFDSGAGRGGLILLVS